MGKLDGRQADAAGKAPLAERGQRGRQLHACDFCAVGERIRANGRDPLADDEFLDGCALPRGGSSLRIVTDLAGAGDGERAVIVERPGDTAAAGAAVDNVRRKRRGDEREHQAQHEQDAQKFLFHAISPLFFRMGAISITKFICCRKGFLYCLYKK